MRAVMARVNQNGAGMDFLLRGGGVTATGEYVEGGKRESFELNGVLLYRKPRQLYLQLQHLAGQMEVGSNDEEFWVWKRFGDERYWWGQHSGIDGIMDTDMPVRPDHLLDVLGLRPLPEAGRLQGPVFWVSPSRYELLYLDRNPGGELHLVKSIDIDRKPPFLIREMVHFRPDGHPNMVAKLSEYKTIQGSTVLAPHRIHMRWLGDNSWLELHFDNMKRFDQSAGKKFISPRQKGGDLRGVERVDSPAPPATRPAPRSSTQPVPR